MQTFFCGARPEMVNFDSGQGRSAFETGGVAVLRQGFLKRENAGPGQKMPFRNGIICHGMLSTTPIRYCLSATVSFQAPLLYYEHHGRMNIPFCFEKAYHHEWFPCCRQDLTAWLTDHRVLHRQWPVRCRKQKKSDGHCSGRCQSGHH